MRSELTFAVVDVEKDQENGKDGHGSKVIVVPFDGAALDAPTLSLPAAYGDVDLSGPSSPLGIGTYSTAQLQAIGIADDSISSLAVPPGYKVAAYSDDAVAGTSWSFTSTNRDLRQTGNNDSISSIVVSLDPAAQFELSNVRSSRSMDVAGASTSDGAAVLQYEYRATANQQWRFEDVGAGFVKIVNRNSGKVLDVQGGSVADGARIIQSTDSGATSQQWRLSSGSDGAITIVNRASGKTAEVSGGSQVNGGELIQWPGSGSANQLWTVVKVD